MDGVLVSSEGIRRTIKILSGTTVENLRSVGKTL
jgi:hypothetical protein